MVGQTADVQGGGTRVIGDSRCKRDVRFLLAITGYGSGAPLSVFVR